MHRQYCVCQLCMLYVGPNDKTDPGWANDRSEREPDSNDRDHYESDEDSGVWELDD